MKQVLSLFMFLLASAACMAQFTYYEPVFTDKSSSRSSYSRPRSVRPELDDISSLFTYYEPVETAPRVDMFAYAKVYYTSSSGHRAEYVLECGISKIYNSLRVVAIYFDKDRQQSVHVGVNKSGYDYSGGGINIRTDSEGDVITANTTVTISYKGSWYKYALEF